MWQSIQYHNTRSLTVFPWTPISVPNFVCGKGFCNLTCNLQFFFDIQMKAGERASSLVEEEMCSGPSAEAVYAARAVN